MIYSNSRVHGNRTLYVEARAYYYKLLLLNCWFRFLFLAGSQGRDLGGIYNCYLIQLIIIQCCSNFCCIVITFMLLNYWLILFLCFKTRRKMLVFDRPSFLPLF